MNKSKFIEHTLLKPEVRKKDIDKIILEAKKYNFKTICINSSWVKYSYEQLKNTEIIISSVIGFPFGSMITQAKVHEAKLAIDHGASEISMVMQIGKLKDGDFEYVLNDINKVKEVIGKHILKVIIEIALLTKDEMIKATEIILKSKADFVETSTGFSFRGATQEDIILLKKIIGNNKKLKVVGEIKTLQDLDEVIALGITRIGTSLGPKLINI